MDALAAFREAHERQDVAAIAATLADDAVLISPITPRHSFRGKAEITELLECVFAISEPPRYLHQAADGDAGIIAWESALAGQAAQEMMIVRVGGSGSIEELRLFIRPLPALVTLAGRLGPRLARAHGHPLRALFAAGLTPIAFLLRAADRLVPWVLAPRR